MTSRPRFRRLIAYLRARISSEGLFGLHLTIGSAALIGSAWLFGGIAEDLINNDPLMFVDAIISEWFRIYATPSVTAKMVLVSSLASTPAVSGLWIFLSAFLLSKRRWYEILALALVVPGGALLNLALKIAFARARPEWGDVDLIGYSFPSGHTMTATLLYGLIGVYFVLRVDSWRWRAMAIALTFMIICAVGFSRIYLGAHYFSDVIAAFAAGAAWLAICLTAVETLRRHRRLSIRRTHTARVAILRLVALASLWSALAFVLNLTWEIAHVSLYSTWLEADGQGIAWAVLHCSLGDVLIALATFALAGVVLRSADWPTSRPWAGGAIAVTGAMAYTAWSEWHNVYRAGNWGYAAGMPLVFGIGLTPLLQWLFLPPVMVAAYRKLRPALLAMHAENRAGV